jgi:putative aldouronate transport system substrate-binding protein
MIAALFSACTSQPTTVQTTTQQGTTKQTTTSGTTAQPTEPGSYFPLKEAVEISVFGAGYWNPIDAPIAYADMLEKLNIKIKWNTPSEGFTEKKDIALATKDIPDLMWVSNSDSIKYGTMGAFVELSQYIDKMPDVENFLTTYESFKYAFMTADSKYYGLPLFTDNDLTTLFWAYNKEMFTKWNIAEPKSLAELLTVARQIKAKDPSRYYPIVGSVGVPQIDFYSVLKSVCNTMGIGDDADINFFIKEDVFKFTPTQPKFKEAVAYVKTLFDEQLISPEYLTLTPGASRAFWSEYEVAGFTGDPNDVFTGFIGSMEFSSVLNFQRWADNETKGLSSKVRGSQFGFMTMSNEVSLTNVNPIISTNSGSTVCIGAAAASNPQKLELLLNLCNWMYSEEAITMFNYGREGVHYDMVDGKPVIKALYRADTPEYASVYFKGTPVRDRIDALNWDYTKVAMEDQLKIWGFYEAYSFMPFNQVTVYKANSTRYPSSIDDQVFALNAELKKNATIIGKKPLPFDADQNKRIIDLKVICKDYTLQEVDKFIMGKRSMDEWDAFVKQLKSMGATELETLYNSVYAYQVK